MIMNGRDDQHAEETGFQASHVTLCNNAQSVARAKGLSPYLVTASYVYLQSPQTDLISS